MTTANELKNLRERIAESDEIADIDRAVLDRFDDRLTLLNQTYTDLRHLKLLRHVTIIAESLPDETLADALDSRDAAEDIVAWVNRTYSNEETNRDYRSALRVFGKRVTDGDDWRQIATEFDIGAPKSKRVKRQLMQTHNEELPDNVA
jgi:hypothetical protein